MKTGLNILICPLEWGLGHASRMIPVARKLMAMNNNVIIASGQEHISLFNNELPEIKSIHFPGFKPGYSCILPQYLHIFIKLPELLFHIIREHITVRKIIRDYAIDIIISDNRFGLWNRSVTSVYVTHQLLIPFPKLFKFMEFAGVILHGSIIKKYSLCFVPDLAGNINLTGRLSHGLKLHGNIRYIGLLSRFTDMVINENTGKEYRQNSVILSGPEPQREILKQRLVTILKDRKPATIILEGKPGNTIEVSHNGNITFYNHLPDAMIKEIVSNSACIISRSGYTTIMELVSLNCTALIIPTPGQTEQEYLADYLSEKGWFYTIKQKEINKDFILPECRPFFHSEILHQSRLLLDEALKEMLDKHHKEK